MSYSKYVSIDLETTGLDSRHCQILEVGMVVDDWSTPVDQLPSCSFLVDPGLIQGEPFALQMNAEILREIAEGRARHFISTVDEVTFYMQDFLKKYFPYHNNRIAFQVAGKNYAGFDKGFLERLPKWFDRFKVHHRALDPGPMYFDPRIDDEVPSTVECLRRAGLDPDVRHRAEEDARNVVRLIRRKAAAQAMADMQSRRVTHE